jgi:hypothetical protein
MLDHRQWLQAIRLSVCLSVYFYTEVRWVTVNVTNITRSVLHSTFLLFEWGITFL